MKKFILLALVLPIHLYAAPVFVAEHMVADSRDMLADMNIYRAGYNLPPLEKNKGLCTLATKRVVQIKSDWSHDQFQGELDQIENMDGVFSENLARTLESKDVVVAWSLSKVGHREAMLIPNMKYGCVVQSGDHYVFEGYTPKVEKKGGL